MPFTGSDNPSLKRPAPSSGFADFPNVGQHAGQHKHGSAPPGPRVMAPSVHNTVFNLAANSNATFPFFAAAFSNNWQQGYKEGMAMFINRQQDDTSGRTTITGRHRSHNIMASVPVLNYYLTVGSCDQTFVERYIKRYSLNEALIPHYPSDSGATRYLTDRLKKNYGSIDEFPIAGSGTLITDVSPQPTVGDMVGAVTLTAADVELWKKWQKRKANMNDTMYVEDFCKKWDFMGTVLTDMDISSRYQKLFNLNVRGRTRIFNTWSTRKNGLYNRKTARDRVQKGDRLYLTLKKVRVDETSFTQPDGTTMPMLAQCEDNTIWQLVCERMTHGVAPYGERDADGLVDPTLNIYVGRVLSAISKKPDEHYIRRAGREHEQLSCLPMIEVALHTEML